jgi:hypothetical protein
LDRRQYRRKLSIRTNRIHPTGDRSSIGTCRSGPFLHSAQGLGEFRRAKTERSCYTGVVPCGVAVFEGVESRVTVAMIVEDIPRLGNDGIHALGAPEEVAEGGVIPACAVVIQPQAGLFSLAGVAVRRRGGAGGEPRGAEGLVAQFAGFSGAVDRVGGAAQVVRERAVKK